MGERAYRFRTVWRVAATPAECWDEICAAMRPGARMWWPGVLVESAPRTLAAGETFVLAVRAPLGYRLRVTLRIQRVDPGRSVAASAAGDLRGRGEVRVEAAPDGSALVFTWVVTTTKGWMRMTAWLLRPVFAAGHAAVMRRGERALRRRLRNAG